MVDFPATFHCQGHGKDLTRFFFSWLIPWSPKLHRSWVLSERTCFDWKKAIAATGHLKNHISRLNNNIYIYIIYVYQYIYIYLLIYLFIQLCMKNPPWYIGTPPGAQCPPLRWGVAFWGRPPNWRIRLSRKVAHPPIHLAVPKKEGMVTEASSKIL